MVHLKLLTLSVAFLPAFDTAKFITSGKVES